MVNNLDCQKKISDYINVINENLCLYLEKSSCLYEQMFYCVLNGGKRLRPLLILSLSGCNENSLAFACAIEFIHNYSLVHDDLPAMDNDDYRRNQLTCHKKFGEANAILTGDALLSLAFEIMIDKCIEQNDKKNILAAKKIINAAGINGMIKGQVLDMASENKIITADELEQIHLNKTAALIRASIETGLILSGANDDTVEKFSQLANKIGLAFQIKDDICDTGEESKATYVSVYGKEKAINIFDELSSEIYSFTKTLNSDYDLFKYLVEYILKK